MYNSFRYVLLSMSNSILCVIPLHIKLCCICNSFFYVLLASSARKNLLDAVSKASYFVLYRFSTRLTIFIIIRKTLVKMNDLSGCLQLP